MWKQWFTSSRKTTKLFSSNNVLLLFMVFIKYKYVFLSSADQIMKIFKSTHKNELQAWIHYPHHEVKWSRRLQKQAETMPRSKDLSQSNSTAAFQQITGVLVYLLSTAELHRPAWGSCPPCCSPCFPHNRWTSPPAHAAKRSSLIHYFHSSPCLPPRENFWIWVN